MFDVTIGQVEALLPYVVIKDPAVGYVRIEGQPDPFILPAVVQEHIDRYDGTVRAAFGTLEAIRVAMPDEYVSVLAAGSALVGDAVASVVADMWWQLQRGHTQNETADRLWRRYQANLTTHVNAVKALRAQAEILGIPESSGGTGSGFVASNPSAALFAIDMEL